MTKLGFLFYVNVGIDPGIIIPTAFGTSNVIVIIVQKRFVVGLRL